MKHRILGRKFNMTPGHREDMIKNLCISLIEHGQIITTVSKAKEVKRYFDKIVTRFKRDNLSSNREIISQLHNNSSIVTKLSEHKDLLKLRNSGYTSIIRHSVRSGDAAEMALIRIVGLNKVVSI